MYDAPMPETSKSQAQHITVVKHLVSGGSEYHYEIHGDASTLPSKHDEKAQAFGIIRPKPKDNLAYDELKCTDDDQMTIGAIISNMAEHGKLWLLAHKGEMNRLGDSIRDVHPLKFLEVIFTNSYLKQCMFGIFDDYFKRNGFMDGLGDSLDAKSSTGELDKYLPHFAKKVDHSIEDLKPFFTSRDWEGMIRWLMNN